MARRKKRSFGGLRKLPSGRWQAKYTAPDGLIYKAPRTFAAEDDAIAWLNAERRLIDLDAWTPPTERDRADEQAALKLTLGEYADRWITHRHLKESTRHLYRRMFEQHIEPELGALPLDEVTSERILVWFADLRDKPGPNKASTGKTRNARVYALLRTIFATAVDDGLISSNPCRIPRAGRTERAHEIRLLSISELDSLAFAMPERLRLLVKLAAWCGLRRGELLELRRGDVAEDGSVVRIRRAVVFVDRKPVVGPPKSDAGVRDVTVPPHIRTAVVDHLSEHVGRGKNALLFTSKDGDRLGEWTLRYHFEQATTRIDRSDLRLHDLRHQGAVLAAQAGATTKELMARLGHSTPNMAMRYQHAAAGRDAQIAERLSQLADGHGWP
ncbi:tyrosine-type recombinase/integrase [Rhodococcus sp. Z13]|uniref:Tyrosine-type recombinase/integrase n=1 Tax=Rhodococcus sacchari TaxID=2962047 RepID=A0ACD4DIC7_9NOCA|nr:tyrosine-type recombinase/integrase [Rhodococcus sp. Z13]UYP19767.1 tyrosine-type recombinase/integrase [Rhodococcus sp. Z13]